MSLADRMSEYVSACFTGLWIQSCEHEDALAEIAQMCRDEDWNLATWDIDGGLQVPGQGDGQCIQIKPLAQCGCTYHEHLDATRLFNLQCKRKYNLK